MQTSFLLNCLQTEGTDRYKKKKIKSRNHSTNNTTPNITHQIQYLDVEFKVFIHSEDVVENVLSDARNDTHLVRVVQLALKQEVTDKGITE